MTKHLKSNRGLLLLLGGRNFFIFLLLVIKNVKPAPPQQLVKVSVLIFWGVPLQRNPFFVSAAVNLISYHIFQFHCRLFYMKILQLVAMH